MRDVSTPCPLCGAAMQQCDYSPLYGYSWIHPKSETTAICENSGKLVFSGNDPIQGGTMTETQLKPCPFCGAAGVKSKHGNYTCSNDYCNLVTMSNGWNYRPIEDALQARIAELEKSAIVWHRFIEGKDEPSESGYYLTLQKISKFHSLVLTEYWVAVPGYWDTKTTITYWAYIPAPPKEES